MSVLSQYQFEQKSVTDKHKLVVSFATIQTEIEQAQRLRYQVFAQEMGAKLQCIDGKDVDKYDEVCQHLVVKDELSNQVVGCYRLLTLAGAQQVGGWYSEAEFDLTPFKRMENKVVELGRACIHKDYRSGTAMMLLWSGLTRFMQLEHLDYMIGCGSISMDDGGHSAASLYTKLAKKYLAPKHLQVTPKVPLDLQHLRADLAIQTPALIKGYLRAGAYIGGEPSYDKDFNTADVLIIMPFERLDQRYIKHFSR